MSNHTPPAGGFGSFLSGLNNGWMSFAGRSNGQEEQEEVSLPHDEEIRISNSNDDNDKIVDDASKAAEITTPTAPRQEQESIVTAAEALVEMDTNKKTAATPAQDDRKRPATTPQRPKPKKKKPAPKNNATNSKRVATQRSDIEVGLDSEVRTVNNPMKMKEAFDNGYDSDGWEGPAKGTNQKEIEEAEEDPLPTAGENDEAVEDSDDDVENQEPRHIRSSRVGGKRKRSPMSRGGNSRGGSSSASANSNNSNKRALHAASSKAGNTGRTSGNL